MSAVVSKARLIPAAILAIFVYGMIASVAGTIANEISGRFGLSPEQIGNVFLAQAIGLIMASVSVGPLLDNKGKKKGLLLGLALIVLALFAIPNSTSYYMIGAFMLVLGLGGGIIVTAANALVSDISDERRASVLNLLNLFFGLGGLATPFIGANIFHGNSIALCYLIAGLTAATLVLHILTPMPPRSTTRWRRPPSISTRRTKRATWTTCRTPSVPWRLSTRCRTRSGLAAPMRRCCSNGTTRNRPAPRP